MNNNQQEFKKGEIVIYNSKDEPKLEVRLEENTIWLTQAQIALLFGTKRPAITKHLKNIFDSGELDEKVVSSILEHTTKHGAIKGKTQTKKVKFYNLDAIISVGYRVNSKEATQFRIWATKILKEHLIKGYTINEKSLLQTQSQLKELQNTISFLQEKAAHLLYFIIKDHPFVDGNKRIASFLFVYFLDKNDFLYRPDGEKKINDNALTALALLIAISDPKEKDKLIKMITNLVAV